MSDGVISADISPEDLNKLVDSGEFDAKELARTFMALREQVKGSIGELGKFYHPKAQENVFDLIRMDLENVVWKLQEATHEILYTAEQIEGVVSGLQIGDGDGGEEKKSPEEARKELAVLTTGLFESCNFQDLTGQRINIVINTLTLIHTHLSAAAQKFDSAVFNEVAVPIIKAAASDTGDENLSGPDLLGTKGMKQGDIDALFK